MIECQNHLFSLEPDVHYLNCAYMSPLLNSSVQAGIQGLVQKSTPNIVTPSDFFTLNLQLRSLFSRLINAEDNDDCFFVPSASYAFAIIEKNLNLSKGDEILILEDQFPSNVYCWHNLAKNQFAEIVTVRAGNAIESKSQDWTQKIIESIGEQTKVVSIGTVHWTDGTSFDLTAIGKKAREVGAFFFLDGTQSVGAMPFDLATVQPDALVCAGYKWMFGPYGTGMAYFSKRLQDWAPLEENWKNRKGSEEFSGLVNYESQYQPKSMRFEVGQGSNFILLPILADALQQLIEWKPERIQEYCRNLTGTCKKQLSNEGFQIDHSSDSQHLFGVSLPDEVDRGALKLLLEKNKIYVSLRGKSLRIAPHLYNRIKDLELLTELLIDLRR